VRLPAVSAAGAIVTYLRDTQRGELAHVRDISLRTSADALLIDPVTVRHLNVVEGAEGGRDGSLPRHSRSDINTDGRANASPLAPAPARDSRRAIRTASMPSKDWAFARPSAPNFWTCSSRPTTSND
jgi:hypothetical protein